MALFFKKILFLVTLFCPLLTYGQMKFVEVTGRSVIEENSPLLSKNSALEDALYLAALQGGAAVSGYSMVDNFSNLKEEIIVRPSSGILDYTIIDEIISDQHYEVTIKALVGKKNNQIGCNSRLKSTLISFAPKIFFSEKSPAWAQYLPNTIYNEIITKISEFDNLDVINASDTNLSSNNKKLKLNEFDYNVLNGNIIYYNPADLSMEIEILIEPVDHLHLTNLSVKQLEKYLKVKTNIFIKDINSNKEVFKTSKKSLSFIGPKKTLFKTINILSRPDRESIIANILKSIEPIAEEINVNLKCINLVSIAQPSKINNAIEIDLGENQGIKIGNLALAESNDTPFTVFEVIKVNKNGSILLPLNTSRNLKNYYGKKITFMEF